MDRDGRTAAFMGIRTGIGVFIQMTSARLRRATCLRYDSWFSEHYILHSIVPFNYPSYR